MKYDICVFGGCAMDQTFFPNNDGSYNDHPDISTPGGKASNQAVAASRAGAGVIVLTRIGNDETGQEILENLNKNLINTDYIEVVDGLKNDASKIYINGENRDNKIVRERGAIDSFTEEMIDKYQNIILNSKLVIAQMKVDKSVTVKLINLCYENNIPIIITPCRPKKLIMSDPFNRELVEKISYITCNRTECQAMFETDDINACVSQYPNKLIVTLGADGLVYHNGKEIIHLEAPEIDSVEDTTGAGDTFNGNLAKLLVDNEPLDKAIYKAQFAAVMKVRVKTAQAGMPYEDELNTFYENHQKKEL